jgi:hypothetical protein
MKCAIAKPPLGFVAPATYVPGGYADFVRQVIRELQRPGMRRRRRSERSRRAD